MGSQTNIQKIENRKRIKLIILNFKLIKWNLNVRHYSSQLKELSRRKQNWKLRNIIYQESNTKIRVYINSKQRKKGKEQGRAKRNVGYLNVWIQTRQQKLRVRSQDEQLPVTDIMYMLKFKLIKLDTTSIQYNLMSQNFNSAKSGYMHIQMKQSSAEMSYNRLGVLLSILAFVWFLCHRAEVQFPYRHLLDTYERIGDKNVTKQAVKHTVELLLGTRTPQQIGYWDYLSQKYKIGKQPQEPLCIILLHQPQTPQPSPQSLRSSQDPQQQKSTYMHSIQSLLKQNYTDYKIFYLNNYKAGQQVYQFLEDNALDRKKFNIIEEFQENDYSKLFQYSKVYCGEHDIVLYMSDQDRLVGKDTFAFVNSLYAADPSVQLLYTGSLIAQPKQQNRKFTYKVGKSYAYPEQIIQNAKYRNYPYIIDGLLTFKANLFDEVQTRQLVNSQNQPYEYIGQVALGTILLKQAAGNIKYVPEPVLVRNRERNYIIASDEVEKQLEDLRDRESI